MSSIIPLLLGRFNSGMNDYVSKPIDPDELGKAIARLTLPIRQKDKKSYKWTRGCNPHVLLALLGGDNKTFNEIMGVFLQDAPRQIRILENAIKQGNAPNVQRQAHTLKGASAIIGATGLEEATLHLATGIRKQNLNQAFEMLDHIKAEFARFERLIAARKGGDHESSYC
jgi:HPt (histidine-containing phosphotransfer) domain-containing protein